jgi:transketolase
MLNKNLKLNSKLFDKDGEQAPIRKGFGEGLLQAAQLDERVVGLCADLTESTTMHIFKKEFPNRFVEIGIAEQNLASVASGMAAMGKITFISSYAMFSPGRNWEQIRTTVCYNNSNVKIAGSHAGVSVGPDGATHQAVEDMAITRVLPNMMVISPCDMLEAKKATLALAQVPSPAYLRLAREPTPVMTTAETPFQIGKAHVFWDAENPKVTIIATGALVHKALVAAKELEKEKVEVVVVNLSTIKPLDTETILREAKRTGRVVTVEEHQIAGGMGSAVAEYLSQVFPVPIEYIGVHNEFGQSGTPEELIEHYGMGVSHIKEAVQKVLSR